MYRRKGYDFDQTFFPLLLPFPFPLLFIKRPWKSPGYQKMFAGTPDFPKFVRSRNFSRRSFFSALYGKMPFFLLSFWDCTQGDTFFSLLLCMERKRFFFTQFLQGRKTILSQEREEKVFSFPFFHPTFWERQRKLLKNE